MINEKNRQRKLTLPLRFLMWLWIIGVISAAVILFGSCQNTERDPVMTEASEIQSTVTSDPIPAEITNLIGIGYDEDVAEALYAEEPEKAKRLSELEYSPFLADLMFDPHAVAKDAERYLAYSKNHPDLSAYDVILYVHCRRDYPFYENTLPAENPDSYLVLVNKYFYLPEDYEPADLIPLSAESSFSDLSEPILGRREAVLQVEALNDAMEARIEKRIGISNAYRSYAHQEGVHAKSIEENGSANAAAVSARPGFSEHQTGLAFDLHADADIMERFYQSEQSDWLISNAHRFGFTIRYQEKFIPYTGYEKEEWHIRYVGVDAATIMYKESICLEEYLLRYADKPE